MTKRDPQRVAEGMATRMVDDVAKRSRRNIHFQVLAASKVEPIPTRPYVRRVRIEPPFPSMWQYRNARGATYHKSQTDEAAAWVKTALLAGYTVRCSVRKRGWYSGRGLQDGLADYWDAGETQRRS
jgi:hypothetical protein